MDKHAEIALKLQALRDDYAARLPNELQALRDLAGQLADAETRRQALDQLSHLAYIGQYQTKIKSCDPN